MTTIDRECSRCGTCCIKGGPALHFEDLRLLENGTLQRGNLITIRKGELVFKPFGDHPQASICELVKISGVGREWRCLFFEGAQKGCGVYENRPLSCRVLECWNTAPVEALVERDTITRYDIVTEDEPVFSFLSRHSEQCACPDMFAIYQGVLEKRYPLQGQFDELINVNIQIRSEAVKSLKLTLAEELFYFGRPIFQLMQQLGGRVTESRGLLRLSWPENG